MINTDGRGYIEGAIQDNENNYIFICVNLDLALDIVTPLIIKVSPSGDTLIRRFYFGQDTTAGFHDIILCDDDNYLIFGAIGKQISNYQHTNHIWTLKVDNEFNILNENRIEVPENYWNLGCKVVLNNDGYVYSAGTICLYGSMSYSHLFLAKFNQEGDTLQTSYPYYNGTALDPHYIDDVLPNDENRFLAFGSGFLLFDYEVLTVDTNLEFIIQEIPDPVNSSLDDATAVWYTDSTYLLSTLDLGHEEDDIQVNIRSKDHALLDHTWIGRPDTSDYPAWRGSIDFTDPNNIFVGGSINHFPGAPVNASIFIDILNGQLDVLGQKYYGGDMNYTIYNLTAVSDGGCLIGGAIFDWQNSQPQDADIWIKKIYPEDIITDAEDTPDPLDSDVSVYPNPGRDRLFIKTARKNLKLQLFADNGTIAIDKAINNLPCQEINTSSLKKGSYLFQITDENKNTVIESGSWIKN
ncbi:MAG: T9SS type A sorting domain-containing protein [Bacteroidales bacterium]|nr:T9SS type A sorting domain-containing protein [Bacteroidales bacterium]